MKIILNSVEHTMFPKGKNELDKNSEKMCENYQANFY